MGTTTKGYPFPAETDSPDGPAQIGALANVCDSMPGIAILTYAQINALSGAAVWTGRKVYQTDTGTNRPFQGEYTYNGVAWRPPWNLPWGVLDDGVATSPQGSITGFVDLAGLTVSWTVVANRKYEVSGCVMLGSTVANDAVLVNVTDGSNVQLQQIGDVVAVASSFVPLKPSVELLGLSAGPMTAKFRAGRTGTGVGTTEASATQPAQIKIADVGPDGAPA